MVPQTSFPAMHGNSYSYVAFYFLSLFWFFIRPFPQRMVIAIILLDDTYLFCRIYLSITHASHPMSNDCYDGYAPFWFSVLCLPFYLSSSTRRLQSSIFRLSASVFPSFVFRISTTISSLVFSLSIFCLLSSALYLLPSAFYLPPFAFCLLPSAFHFPSFGFCFPSFVFHLQSPPVFHLLSFIFHFFVFRHPSFVFSSSVFWFPSFCLSSFIYILSVIQLLSPGFHLWSPSFCLPPSIFRLPASSPSSSVIFSRPSSVVYHFIFSHLQSAIFRLPFHLLASIFRLSSLDYHFVFLRLILPSSVVVYLRTMTNLSNSAFIFKSVMLWH